MKDIGDVAALRRFARASGAPVERCSACRAPLPSSHGHRLEAKQRRLECLCRACATVDDPPGSSWRIVPRRVVELCDFKMGPSDWERLAVPIRLAFFVVSSVDARAHVFFPSPAGATEAELDPRSWVELRAQSPEVMALREDVEALLVHHVGTARDHYLVSIDVCYRLVGTLRRGWRGFSGGPEVWAEIDVLMDGLRQEGAGA
jgi:hypothetical protein